METLNSAKPAPDADPEDVLPRAPNQLDSPLPRAAAHTARLLAAAALAAIAAYYVVVITLCPNIPFFDDYFAILSSSLRGLHSSTVHQFLQAMWAQNNEHRVVIVRLIGFAEAKLGRISFWSINLIGNLFELVAAWFLFRSFFPKLAPRQAASGILRHKTVAVVFLVLCLLCFNFAFFRVLAFAMVAVSNIGVYAFAIAGFYYATRNRYLSSAAFLLLSALSQANGLAGLPLAAVYYAFTRQFKAALAFALAACAVGILYFRHYNLHAGLSGALPRAGHPEGLAPHLLSIPYFVIQVGSIAGVNHKELHLPLILLVVPVLAGLLLLASHLIAWKSGAFRRRPALQITLIFLLLSLAAAAISRVSADPQTWLQSRYKLISCLYAAILVAILPSSLQLGWWGRAARKWVVAAAAVVWTGSLVYLVPQVMHYRAMRAPLVADHFSPPQRKAAEQILREAEQSGIYTPPRH